MRLSKRSYATRNTSGMRVRGQFNFVWLFAIVVGGAILALAVYGAMKAGDIATNEADTKTAKSLAIITDPMQAGFSEGTYSSISFRQQTTINNYCFTDYGEFGRHKVSVESEVDLRKTRYLPGEEISITNKYIFSEESMSGEDYYVFSKPFKLPYKVADMLFLTSEKYCFIDAPDEIVDEIEGMNMANILVENCSEGGFVNVCFESGGDCDIRVYGSCSGSCVHRFEEGIVEKDGVDMRYVGDLIYGAIFSDPRVYECNVERLLYRTSAVAEVLFEKADLMDARGCDTNLKTDVFVWKGLTSNATSGDLAELRGLAKSLDRKKGGNLCDLWE